MRSIGAYRTVEGSLQGGVDRIDRIDSEAVVGLAEGDRWMALDSASPNRQVRL